MSKELLKLISIACLLPVLFFNYAQAQQLEIPIIERTDGDLDTCSFAQVEGLKKGGDGFLAVRSGPSTSYDQLDELKNGDKVWVFDTKGNWVGIVYGNDNISCSPIAEDRPVKARGKKGWVHQNWVQLLAG